MAIKSIVLALFVTLSASSQIENGSRILVPGTRIYLEKPENFKLTSDFIGLESGQSVIQFLDLSGGNFESNSKSFTKENFEAKGIIVYDFKQLKIGPYPAKFAFIQGDPGQKSLQLVFGDDEFSVMVMAFIPDFEEEKIETIENSFSTIEYDKKREVDPFEIAFFELDDSKSNYKYSKTISNMFLYTKNGIKKDNFIGESAYLVSQLPTDRPNMDPKILFDTSLNSLIRNGLTISGRKTTSRKKLNGFECYEELIQGTLNNEETHLFLTSVVSSGRAVIINAVAKDNFESTLQEFEELTNELRMQ